MSSRWLTPVLCVFVLSGPGCATFAVEFTGRVTEVIDGDSLIFVHDADREHIGLYAIDCPEFSQPFGPEAKEATAAWVLDQQVAVKPWGGPDFYTGHLTGKVVLPDGRNLSRELVKVGLAWWDRDYPDETELAELEAQARAAKRGLWADPDPTPPWEFRELPKSRRSSVE